MNTNTLQSVQSNDTGLDNTVYFIGQDLHSNNVYVTVMVNQVREDGTSYGKVVASESVGTFLQRKTSRWQSRIFPTSLQTAL